LNPPFNNFFSAIIKYTGSPMTFVIVTLLIIIWAISGPIFKFSDTWQLVANTATSVVTFLMVFVLQQSQNKDTTAIHLKLNELIACNKSSSNRLINIEDLTPEELDALKNFYIKLASLAKEEIDIYSSHSIDEAKSIHAVKKHEIAMTQKNLASTQ
jgi:low affinity Fe/Cu permease